MPTPRKRIGYLPSIEIQNIISNISHEKKISQSKLTGLLVEEALSLRGIIEQGSKKNKSNNNSNMTDYISSIKNKNKIQSINNHKDTISNTSEYKDEEYELLSDYLKFKRFKKMLKLIKDENIDINIVWLYSKKVLLFFFFIWDGQFKSR